MEQINSKIPEKVKSVANMVDGFIVGGCVRDSLLNHPIHDFDISTPFKPEDVTAILQKEKLVVIPTGLKFGTVTVVVPEFGNIEITTFRKEEYTRENGRHPDVSYHTNQKGDLMRRDFTINAMAYDPRKNELIDPWGGYADLREKRIEFVSDAEERIKEDPLRMIRACRFASHLDFILPTEVKKIIFDNRKELMRVSQERIVNETWRAQRHMETFFRLIDETGLDEYVFGLDMQHLKNTVHDFRGSHYGETVFQHTLDVLSRSDIREYSYPVKMALMFHDVGKYEVESHVENKTMFIGHEKYSESIFRKTFGKMKGVPYRQKSEIAFLIGEHMKFPKLESPNQIARAVVDWRISGKTINEIKHLMQVSTCDRNTDFSELWEKITSAWGVTRPDGTRFIWMEPPRRKDHVRSMWIENTQKCLQALYGIQAQQ